MTLVMPRLRKVLLTITGLLCVIVLVLTTLLLWVVFTETGTRQLFAMLEKNRLLSYQTLQGSIAHGLRFDALAITLPGAEFAASELVFSANLAELFYSRLQLRELSANTVTIVLMADDSKVQPDQPFSLAFLKNRQRFIPFEVVVEQLSIQQLTLKMAGATHTLQEIKLSSQANPRGIAAMQLSLAYQQTRLRLEGTAYVAPELKITMALNWSSLLPDGSPLEGTAMISGDAKQLTIEQNSGASLVSAASISITEWLDQPYLTLHGEVAALSWPLTRQAPPQLSGVVFSAQGDLSRIQAKITGQAKLTEVNNASFDLLADLSPTALDIKRLLLTDSEAGSARISGQLSWVDSLPRWQGLLSLSDFDARTIHPLLPHQLAGKLTFEGSYGDKLQLSITSAELQGLLRERLFSAQLKAQLTGDSLRVDQLKASVGDNSLALTGVFDKSTMKAKFDAHLVDLKDILPGLKGALQVNGTLSGSPDSPTLKARAQGQQLAINALTIGTLDMTVELIKGVLVSQGNRLAAQNIRYQSVHMDTLKLSMRGSWQHPQWAMAIANPALQLTADGDLQLGEPGISGQLNNLRLDNENAGVWQLETPLNYRLAGENWSVSPLCLESTDGSVCLQASSTNARFNASLTVQQLPASLLNAFGILPTPVSGNLDMDAHIEGDSQRNRGQLRISQSRADTPLVISAADAPGTRLSIADLLVQATLENGSVSGQLEARLNETGSLTSQFEIGALLSDHSPLTARIDYKIPDLQPYAIVLPEIDALSGELEGTIELGNSLQQPRFSLYTRLHVPRIYISPLAMEWTDLTAEITTLSGARQQLEASVTAGDGTLALSGSLAFISASEWISDLRLQGDRALLMDQPNRRVIASPDMYIRATANSLDVRGQLLIPEASLKFKPSPSRLALTSDAIVHGEQADSSAGASPMALTLQLDVVAGEKVNFEAYGLNTDVTGKLSLSQVPAGSLLGYGTLNLINGAYQAYGQDLIIERGIIRFSGQLGSPDIDLTASRSINSVRAGLHVNGPVDNLQTRLFSDPALPDSEILSYIIRGKPLRGASAADKNVLANALLAYSISQSSPVTAKLTELSGLDEIGFAAEEGIETLGFTLGKYLTPRLYARYGIGVIDKLSKVFLQYQLSDKLYLETESGEGQSIDLIYRSQ